MTVYLHVYVNMYVNKYVYVNKVHVLLLFLNLIIAVSLDVTNAVWWFVTYWHPHPDGGLEWSCWS